MTPPADRLATAVEDAKGLFPLFRRLVDALIEARNEITADRDAQLARADTLAAAVEGILARPALTAGLVAEHLEGVLAAYRAAREGAG